MQKYRVISGSCVGKTKVYRCGDIVTASDVDNAEKRVNEGFLVVVESAADETPALPAEITFELPAMDTTTVAEEVIPPAEPAKKYYKK